MAISTPPPFRQFNFNHNLPGYVEAEIVRDCEYNHALYETLATQAKHLTPTDATLREILGGFHA